MKKNILIVVEGYFPAQKYGGPPVSIKNFCELLKNEYNFYIMTRDYDIDGTRLEHIKEGWNESNEANIIYLSRNKFNRFEFQEIIDEVNPDMIYINSFFDYELSMKFILVSLKNKINILLAPRGQLLQGAMERKKALKKLYLVMFKLFINNSLFSFQSTSSEETTVLHRIFPENKIIEIQNIPSTSKSLTNHIKEEKVLRLVFLSRIVEKKNLLYALEILEMLSLSISLDIYGPIEDKIYWEICQKKISELPSNIVVVYKGLAEPKETINIFSNYDAFLFPTKSENFGHVISESLIAGCPVIISDKTPWNDIAKKEAGYVVPLENKNGFRDAIQDLFYMPKEQHKKFQENARKYIEKNFQKDELKENIINAIFQIIRNNEDDYER